MKRLMAFQMSKKHLICHFIVDYLHVKQIIKTTAAEQHSNKMAINNTKQRDGTRWNNGNRSGSSRDSPRSGDAALRETHQRH